LARPLLVMALFLDVLMRLDEEASRTGCRIINCVTRLGFSQLDQQTNDLRGRIKFASLFPCTIGEHA
jgi:hypothetical protein